MAYSDKVLDHYSNPRNVGSMDKNSNEVGTGLVGAPECGDVMKLADQGQSADQYHRRRQVSRLSAAVPRSPRLHSRPSG